jgi:hypothetical protein
VRSNATQSFDAWQKYSAGLDAKQRWDHRWEGVTLDWELALKATMPDIFKLFRLYGQKVKRP